MKKIMLVTMAAMAMASCTQNDEIFSNDDLVEIKLNGGIETTVVSRAAVNKGDALSNIQFVKVDGETISDLKGVNAISTTGDMVEAGTITFQTTQYYPSTNGKTNIIGFYPAATSVANGVASMTITGAEDVLYAPAVSGNKTEEIKPNLQFGHKLTQFKFVLKRDATSTDADITNVKVAIKDANTTFDMNLYDGKLSLDWATPISTITPIVDATATKDGTPESAGIMLQPDLSTLNLLVSATGYPEDTVSITGTDAGKFAAGKAYTITLTFKGKSITPTGEIAEWTKGTAGGADIQQ